MATFFDITSASSRTLLRAGRAPCRVLTTAETVAAIEADIGSVDRCSMPSDGPLGLLKSEDPDEIGLVAARTLHSRRALARAADHGVALLAALNLPQIVRAHMSTVDPAAIGDALDVVIAHLDALDAPAEDLEETGDAEPCLGWTPHVYQTTFNIGGTVDIEHDTADFEDDDPREETSLETTGRGFVRCGADDDEDGFDIEEQHDAEQTYEDGSEDEPYPWRFQPDAWSLVAGVHHG